MVEFASTIAYSVIMGLITAVPATAIVCYLRKVFYIPLAKKKILEKAIADGHTVRAVLTESHAMLGDENYPLYNGKWQVVYQYQYGGKNYRYKGISRNYPEDEITLYFETNPKEACSRNELGYRQKKWKKYYFPVAIACVIGFLIGEACKYVL